MTNPDSPFAVDISPDWEAFLRCLRRECTPQRVHFAELLIDDEVKAAVAKRFLLLDDVDPEDSRRRLESMRESAAFRRAAVQASVGLRDDAESELGSLRHSIRKDAGALLAFAEASWGIGVPRAASHVTRTSTALGLLGSK